MEARISAARGKPPHPYQSEVPDTALDKCEKSYEAADEKKEKSLGTKFDDTGLMALVCRHDSVLFLANVDTPGEQQKFGRQLPLSSIKDSGSVRMGVWTGNWSFDSPRSANAWIQRKNETNSKPSERSRVKWARALEFLLGYQAVK